MIRVPQSDPEPREEPQQNFDTQHDTDIRLASRSRSQCLRMPLLERAVIAQHRGDRRMEPPYASPSDYQEDERQRTAERHPGGK